MVQLSNVSDMMVRVVALGHVYRMSLHPIFSKFSDRLALSILFFETHDKCHQEI